MFKIINHKFVSVKKVNSLAKKCDDPLIIDIRYKQDFRLQRKFGRNYVHVKELVNRGEKEIIFPRAAGQMRSKALLDKARNFERELVIIYENKRHFVEVRRLFNGRKVKARV